MSRQFHSEQNIKDFTNNFFVLFLQIVVLFFRTNDFQVAF